MADESASNVLESSMQSPIEDEGQDSAQVLAAIEEVDAAALATALEEVEAAEAAAVEIPYPASSPTAESEDALLQGMAEELLATAAASSEPVGEEDVPDQATPATELQSDGTAAVAAADEAADSPVSEEGEAQLPGSAEDREQDDLAAAAATAIAEEGDDEDDDDEEEEEEEEQPRARVRFGGGRRAAGNRHGSPPAAAAPTGPSSIAAASSSTTRRSGAPASAAATAAAAQPSPTGARSTPASGVTGPSTLATVAPGAVASKQQQLLKTAELMRDGMPPSRAARAASGRAPSGEDAEEGAEGKSSGVLHALLAGADAVLGLQVPEPLAGLLVASLTAAALGAVVLGARAAFLRI